MTDCRTTEHPSNVDKTKVKPKLVTREKHLTLL